MMVPDIAACRVLGISLLQQWISSAPTSKNPYDDGPEKLGPTCVTSTKAGQSMLFALLTIYWCESRLLTSAADFISLCHL